jgi:hypothetical protein
MASSKTKGEGRFEFHDLPWGREIVVSVTCLEERVISSKLWMKTKIYIIISQYLRELKACSQICAHKYIQQDYS